MRARLGDTVIAEADEKDLISIEGNWYFPPESIAPGVLTTTDTAYTCPWKGDATYYSVNVDGEVRPDRGWSYDTPFPSAIERVGKDFSRYVAFWKDVEVSA